MHRSLAVLIALFAAHAAAAQAPDPAWVVRLNTGVESHSPGDLAGWQDEERRAIVEEGVPVQQTDAFPSFPGVRLEVGYAGERWARSQRYLHYEVGAEVGFGSTGGRLYYEDYSGVFRVDRRVRRLLLGAYVEHEIAPVGALLFSGRLHVRASPTTTAYDREVRVGEEEVERVEESFRTVPLSVYPALVLEAALTPALRVRGSMGYERALGPRLQDGGGDLPPEASWATNGPRVKWEGTRLEAGLALRLGGGR
jgi:hypothetical protein